MPRLKIFLSAICLVALVLTGLIGPAVGNAAGGTLENAVNNPVQFDGSTPLVFVTSSSTGTGDWIVSSVTQTVSDGSSVQSGPISHGQSSRLETSVTGSGAVSVSFYQRVSSESIYDGLSFYDGTKLVSRISGSMNWVQRSYLVSAGTHTLRWEYKKSPSITKGTDAAWINKVVVSPYVAVKVDYPNGGQWFPAGSTKEIVWSAPAAAEKYSLYYTVNNGTTWSLIAGNITGSVLDYNSYPWTVPVPLGTKNACKVKVVAYNSANMVVGTALSDKPFTIEVLEVSSPDGRDILSANAKDSPVSFQFWIYGQQTAASAVLSYTTDNGATWRPIGTLTDPRPGNYAYNWYVPAVLAAKTACKVKVVLKSAAGAVLATDVSNAHFTILPVYTVSGVATQNGSALSGVTVTLGGAETLTTTTDSLGKYSFTKLLKGNYTVTAAKTGYVFNPAASSVALTTANNTTTSFKAVASADPTYTLSGVVTGATSTGVKVTLLGAVGGTTMTDDAGNYAFGNLPAGNYTIVPTKIGYTFAPLSSAGAIVDADVTGVDFASSTITGATYGISGKVVLAGTGKAGVRMTLSTPGVPPVVMAMVITDSLGNYSIKGLKNGLYTLTPTALGYSFTSRGVKIASANLTAVNFTAAALPRIGAPATVTATAAAANQITVEWSAVSSPNGSTGYNVYSSNTAWVAVTPGNKVNGAPIVALSFGHKGLKPLTSHYYRVTAVDAVGESSGSAAEAAAATPAIVGGTIQGLPLVLADPPVVTTFAGLCSNLTGTTNGIGEAAQFNSPAGATTDGTNLYITELGNNTVRKIVIATREVSTFAGLTSGLTGTADGIGTAAGFSTPYGITSDGTNLYVADSGNFTIRKIVIATGEVSTLAGTAGEMGVVNAVGADARFYYPSDITHDGTSLYVTENPPDRLRKIDLVSRMVTTLDTTPASDRYFSSLTSDGTYVYATSGIGGSPGGIICKIDPSTGAVTDIAGDPAFAGSLDGTGSGARFSGPTGITTDGTNLYVTDFGNGTIRKIVIATGQVTTLSNDWGIWAHWPRGITSDGASLYISVQYDNCINKIE